MNQPFFLSKFFQLASKRLQRISGTRSRAEEEEEKKKSAVNEMEKLGQGSFGPNILIITCIVEIPVFFFNTFFKISSV